MKIIEWFLLPIGRCFGISVLIAAMICVANIVGLYVCISHWIPPMSLVVQLCRAILISWGMVLIWQIIKTINVMAGRVFLSTVIILLAINLMLDVWTYSIFHLPFSSDYVPAIRDTHLSEVRDFLTTYLTLDFWKWLAVAALSVTVLYIAAKRITPLMLTLCAIHPRVMIAVSATILILCSFGTAKASRLMGGNTDIIGKAEMFLNYNPAQEITAITPELVRMRSENDSPDEIVIIVGESLSKDHCQLYGYDRPNQPRLSQMAQDSTILVFNNAKTSASYTVKTFQNIMGVWSESLPKDSAWHKCPTFFQILSRAGYHTAWISNQERRMSGGSPIATMSQVADMSFWTNDGIATHPSYDGNVLSYIKKRNLYGGDKKLTLIHLYGSHMICKDRYPQSHRKWVAEDYSDRPLWQRETLADYDNSILYNDSVVSVIFKLYENRDAIVFYFSDHGEDLYQSDSKFYGHGMAKGTKSWEITSNIPFLIYMTPKMKMRCPDLVERIRRSTDNDINTTNLTYTLMDIAGVSIKGHLDDMKLSFFSQQ